MVIKPTYAQELDLAKEFDFGIIKSLGEATGQLIPVIFTSAALLLIFFFVWGAVRLIISGGDKEAVGKARGLITHTIIGFILLIFVFLLLQFLPEFFGLNYKLFR